MRNLSVRQRIVVLVGAAAALLLLWLLVSRTSGGSQGGGSASTKAGLAGGGGAGSGGRAGTPPPDPRTSPRGSIAGRVLDPAGKAVPSARVCGIAWSEELVSADVREPSCVDARPDGSYRLENLMTARYFVQAQAPGHKPGRYRDQERKQTLRLRPGETKTGIDIVLKPGGVEVRGRVKDISGGVVAGAFVTVSSGGWWSWSDASANARSNEQGEFVTWAAPGGVRVSARAEGYADGSSEGTAPGQFIEVLLTPESVLVGRVVEAASERGVPGAIVEVSEDAFGWGFRSSSASSALTDGDGRFRIDRLSPGRYKPTATAAGRWGKAAESVLLGLGQTSAEVVIEVHAAVEVAGRIIDAESKEGCKDGWVQLRDDELDRDEWEQTAEDGSVHFKAVLPGTYRASVSCEDYVDGEGYARVVVKDQPVTGLVWEVKRGLAIRGLVVDSEGHPVPEVTMWASVKGGNPRAQRSWGNAESEDDGSFEIEGLTPGTYSIHVNSEDHPEPKDPPEVAVDKADVSGVKIVLDASGTIEGVVVDEGAQPVGGIEVRALGDRWSWGAGGARSRDDGGFTLKGLRAGDYRVYASRNWDAMRAPGTTDDDIQGQRVTLGAGKTERVRLVIESRRGEIHGRVLDERGKPVPDAFVDAERESDSKAAQAGSARRELRWAWGDREPVLTDLDGRFTIGKLAKGSYTVNAYRRGGGEAVAEKVAVGTTVTLTIKATGAVTGTVSAGGKPPEEFTVSISDRKEGFQREEHFFRTGGRFALRDLPAGNYDVSASAPEGTDLEKVPLAEGQQRDGVALELEALAKVKGRVISLEEGKPVPGMMVQVAPVRGGSDFIVMNWGEDEDRKNITDADGRFEVERAPPGKVNVSAWPIEWDTAEYTWSRTIATLEPGKTNELPPIRVPKRRVKARERGGDVGFTTKQQPPDVEPDEMRWEVAVIRPGGPAEKSELKVGDVIVSVDGHDVTGADGYLFWSLSQVPQGTAIAFGLERGETVTITAGKPQ